MNTAPNAGAERNMPNPSGPTCNTATQQVNGVGTIKLGSSVNWQTSYFSDLLNSPQYRIGNKHFVNGFIGFTTANRRWDFTLTARNIGNAFYFSTLSPVSTPLRAGPFAGTQLVQGAQNAPRTIFFKVVYQY